MAAAAAVGPGVRWWKERASFAAGFHGQGGRKRATDRRACGAPVFSPPLSNPRGLWDLLNNFCANVETKTVRGKKDHESSTRGERTRTYFLHVPHNDNIQ